jgi:hypothetical protein
LIVLAIVGVGARWALYPADAVDRTTTDSSTRAVGTADGDEGSITAASQSGDEPRREEHRGDVIANRSTPKQPRTLVSVLTRENEKIRSVPRAIVELFLREDIERGEATALRMGTTDDAGSVEFETETLHVDRNELSVRVQCEGFATVNDEIMTDRVNKIELWPAARFVGRLISLQTGLPIESAKVFVESAGVHFASSERVSDGAGLFTIKGVPSVGQFGIAIVRAGFVTQSAIVECAEGGAPVDIVLSDGCSLIGRAVDVHTGNGVAGARVDSFAGNGGVITDANGTFRARGFIAYNGHYNARVEADDYCRTYVFRHPDGDGETHEITIPMVRSCSVRGRVVGIDDEFMDRIRLDVKLVDANTVEPLEALYPDYPWLTNHPDGKISGVMVGNRMSRGLRVSADGAFQISGLIPHSRPYRVLAWSIVTDREAASAAITCDNPESQNLVVSFGPVGSIAGTVTPAAPGLSVRWKGPTMDGYAAEDDGRFVADGVEVGEVTIEVTLYSDVVGRQTVTVRDGEKVTCEFSLTSSVDALTGVVVTPSGTPIANAFVGVVDDNSRSDVKTDEHGRFNAFVAKGREHRRLRYRGATWGRGGLMHGMIRDIDKGETEFRLVVPDIRTLRITVIDATTGKLVPDVTWRWATRLEDHLIASSSSEDVQVGSDGTGTILVPDGRTSVVIDAGIAFDEVTIELEPGQTLVEPVRIGMSRSKR